MVMLNYQRGIQIWANLGHGHSEMHFFQLLFGRILQLVSHQSPAFRPEQNSAMHGADEHPHVEGEAEKEVEEGHGCPVLWLRLVEHGGAAKGAVAWEPQPMPHA